MLTRIDARPLRVTHQTAFKGSRAALLLATGFGLGYIPFASGSWGSLASLVFYVLFEHWVPKIGLFFHYRLLPGSSNFFLLHLTVIGIVSLVGVYVAGRAEQYFGETDPHRVVVDEISGQQVVFLGLAPVGWPYLIAGFLLFRIFDVWKPFPARQAESWPGGWGIMADDWFAAAYAALILSGTKLLLH